MANFDDLTLNKYPDKNLNERRGFHKEKRFTKSRKIVG